MHTIAVSINVATGGTTEKVAMSVASAPVATALGTGMHTVTVDATCFMRRGSAPVAVADVDQILLAGTTHRISGCLATDKIAFIMASGTGNAWVTRGESA